MNNNINEILYLKVFARKHPSSFHIRPPVLKGKKTNLIRLTSFLPQMNVDLRGLNHLVSAAQASK